MAKRSNCSSFYRTFVLDRERSARGGIGIHNRLKICPHLWVVGSSPTAPTILTNSFIFLVIIEKDKKSAVK